MKTLKLKQDHAFASYFAAICYKKMNLKDQYQTYKTKYQKILDKSVLWLDYAKRFNLPYEPSEFRLGINILDNEQVVAQA